MNITLEGRDELEKFTQMVDLNQSEGVKNFTIEILMDKVNERDLGTYELIFNVSDMYTFSEFYCTVELIDVTPVTLAPPLPELPPKFIMPLERIEVNYTINGTNTPVSYILPDAFDYNFDSFTIFFEEHHWEPWAHILSYDGSSIVTVKPDNLLPSDIEAIQDTLLIE